MPIKITDKISTTAPSDTYATHDSNLGQGGLHSVADAVARDAIPLARRQAGMMVFTAGNQKHWVLNIDLITWIEITLGGTNVVYYTAGAAVSNHSIVAIDAANTVVHADNTIMDHVNKIIGITTGAALLGEQVPVQLDGEIVEPSWTWTLGSPVYLGTNGQLTQVVPVSGFSIMVGIPTTSTKMRLRFREPVVLI